MDDVFLEKIVTKRKTGKDYAMVAAALVGSVVLFLLLLQFAAYISFLLPLVLIGIGYGLWFLITSINKEYEYIVTNGDLDVDMIIARRKRKRVLSVKAKEFELMAQTGTTEERDAEKGGYKVLDFSAAVGSDKNWFILTNYKQEKVKVIFEPDERMLKNLKRFNPSRIRYVGPLN